LNSIAFRGNPSHIYGASPAIGDHTVLPATRHRWTCPHHNPSQTGQYLIYLPQRDGRLSWPGCWLYAKMVYLSADSHLSKYWPVDSCSTGSRTQDLDLSLEYSSDHLVCVQAK